MNIKQMCPYGLPDIVCILGNRYRQVEDDLWLIGRCDSCWKATGGIEVREDASIQLAIDVVADMLGLDPGEVSASSDLCDLGADQQDVTNIVTEMEFRLKIDLPTDLENACTVSDLAAGVRAARRSLADFSTEETR